MADVEGFVAFGGRRELDGPCGAEVVGTGEELGMGFQLLEVVGLLGVGQEGGGQEQQSCEEDAFHQS